MELQQINIFAWERPMSTKKLCHTNEFFKTTIYAIRYDAHFFYSSNESMHVHCDIFINQNEHWHTHWHQYQIFKQKLHSPFWAWQFTSQTRSIEHTHQISICIDFFAQVFYVTRWPITAKKLYFLTNNLEKNSTWQFIQVAQVVRKSEPPVWNIQTTLKCGALFLR